MSAELVGRLVRARVPWLPSLQPTAELIAANPRVQGHSFENEAPYAEQWHLGVERQLFPSMLVEVAYVGSAGKHLMLCYNPNEIQPGPGRRCRAGCCNRSPRSATCCSATLAIVRRSTLAR